MTTLNRIVLTLIITALAATTIAAQQEIEPKITNLGPKEAPDKLKRDAERGDPRSQFLIGEEYNRAKDYQNAFVWFRKSAMQGYADGQWYLGVMYMWGLGTAKEDSEAVKWFLKAAEQHHIVAIRCLSAAYYFGSEKVARDLPAAYMWVVVAASLEDPNPYSLIVALLKELMTAEQATEGERRASEWLAEHPKA